MKTALIVLIVLSLFGGCASAQKSDKLKSLTIEKSNALASALRNLDGHMVIVKQNGVDNPVMIPWEFGDAKLRLRIAKNIAILDEASKIFYQAQTAIFKELAAKYKVQSLNVGTPEFAEYNRQNDELVKQPAHGTEGLAHFKASELKLDKNEIPVTVLEALAPILEDDVSK